LNHLRAAIGSQDASQAFSTAGSRLLAFLELITKLNSVTRSAQSIWLVRSGCASAVGGQAVSAGLSIVESLRPWPENDAAVSPLILKSMTPSLGVWPLM